MHYRPKEKVPAQRINALLSVKGLKSEFCVDDVTLGGQLDEVIQDVQQVEGAAGLILNHHKSEILCADPSTKLAAGDELPAAQVMDPG